MDQSESFEPDKKRSARRPQQEQEASSAARRLRGYPQHQTAPPPPQHSQTQAGVAAAARGQPTAYQQQQQPPYGLPSQVRQTTGGGYHQQAAAAAANASANDYGTNLAAMATASYPSADPYAMQQEQQRQQQLLYQQQQQQQQQRLAAAQAQASSYGGQPAYPAAPGYPYYPAAAGAAGAAPQGGMPHMPVPPPGQQSYIQPRAGRLPSDRPLIKLSVSLIDTYKHINTVYYEERDARRKSKEKSKGSGANNNGWDDENYDYIITPGELFYGRYRIKERIGKGSFGQVVRAEDIESKREVAIKIIKSKKPFLMQAKTEIELLTHLWEKDQDDQHNIGEYRPQNKSPVVMIPVGISHAFFFLPLNVSTCRHSPLTNAFHVSEPPVPCV